MIEPATPERRIDEWRDQERSQRRGMTRKAKEPIAAKHRISDLLDAS